jgi:PleD family two-component response regulator
LKRSSEIDVTKALLAGASHKSSPIVYQLKVPPDLLLPAPASASSSSPRPAGDHDKYDDDAAAAVSNDASSSDKQGRCTSCLHILVVDDALPILKVVSRYLESEGHHVETAKNGFVALERMKKAIAEDVDESTSLDLVLMDIQMPVMGKSVGIIQI